MADKQPTFAERIELLADAAEIVRAEAERMATAAERFAERDAKRTTKASR